MIENLENTGKQCVNNNSCLLFLLFRPRLMLYFYRFDFARSIFWHTLAVPTQEKFFLIM